MERSKTTQYFGAKPIPLAITFAVGLVIWFSPAPEGLNIQAWHLFAIFVATIVGIISKALPMGAVTIGSVAIVAATGVLDPDNAKNAVKLSLAGLSNSVLWLIIVAYFIARGFIKTGLGERIAYYFVRLMGKKTLGLSYGVTLADLFISPVIPSSSARGGGIVFPIIDSLSRSYGSLPNDPSKKKIGGFLMMTEYHINLITGGMFLTAGVGNPLMISLANDFGLNITWGGWLLASVVPCILSLILVPYFNYKICNPEIKETPNAVIMANEKLKQMGKMHYHEWIMLGAFIGLIVLWIFSKEFGIHTTTTALLGLLVLLIFGVLDWEDVKNEKSAWNTLIWFSTLLMLASNLSKLGFIAWFTNSIDHLVHGYNWVVVWFILIAIYVYAHYFFASLSAHIVAMFSAFLALGIAVGVPPMLMCLSLFFGSHYYGSLTNYGGGPVAILFDSGYVDIGEWWRQGFLVSVLNFIIFMVIGAVWWKFLGLW